MNEKSNVTGMHSDPARFSAGDFGGRGVRRVRIRDRHELEAFANAGQPRTPVSLETVDDLVRDANTLRPENLNALRGEMDRLQSEWESLDEGDRASVSEWIESICLPWIKARVPLRGNGLEPSWAGGFLLSLLSDFDSSGQVVDSIDPGWQRPSRSAGDVETTARLAVAAGWLGWSHLIVDPRLALSAVNVLGELLDRLDRLTHSDASFSASDRGWTLTAIALERRLLRHWHPLTGGVH
jgi:hypothetical protein